MQHCSKCYITAWPVMFHNIYKKCCLHQTIFFKIKMSKQSQNNGLWKKKTTIPTPHWWKQRPVKCTSYFTQVYFCKVYISDKIYTYSIQVGNENKILTSNLLKSGFSKWSSLAGKLQKSHTHTVIAMREKLTQWVFKRLKNLNALKLLDHK